MGIEGTTSRTAGRSEFSAAEPFAAGDVVGCEALFDEEGRYAGAVAFDVNGGPPQRLAHRLSDDELAAGALCPAVTLGRGDRVQINFCRPVSRTIIAGDLGCILPRVQQ